MADPATNKVSHCKRPKYCPSSRKCNAADEIDEEENDDEEEDVGPDERDESFFDNNAFANNPDADECEDRNEAK
jgi:hypothetical protein